jgi:predicted esterase YcpF (UPF0227 family)
MLYYIHGYQSSPDSAKGGLFKEKLGATAIKYRDCEPEDLVISECLENISNVIKDDDSVFLIGSSLGGFLVAKTAIDLSNVKKIVLLNPAIIPPDYDITKISDMPQRILKEMKSPELFEKEIDSEILIFVGTNDKVVPRNWVMDFARFQQSSVRFLHDDHRFSKNLEKLPVLINSFLYKKH